MARTSITITADQFTKNWQNGMNNNVTKMKDGVGRVTENPMAKAAEAVDRQVAGVQRAAQSGKTQAALLAVDLASWKTVTMQKIGERLSGGVAAAATKMNKFGQYLISTVNQGMAQVNTMPKLTLADSKAKMIAWVDFMAANPYKR